MSKKAKSNKGAKVKGIYLRGNIFWLTYRVDGKKKWESLDTDDHAEAVSRAQEILADPLLLGSGAWPPEIEAFLAHKVAANEYSRKSASAKQWALREFADQCGKDSPAKVTKGDCEQFYDTLRKRVSESTAQGYMATLRSFFGWMVHKKKLRKNPVADVKLARLDAKGRGKFCAEEERDRLIDSCTRTDLRYVLYCGFHAGLRKDEIIQSERDWFDLDRGFLEVKETPHFRPKDRTARHIPLTKEFLAFLRAHEWGTGFMLHPENAPKRNGYRWDFRKPFADHVTSQGLAWVTPHVMRHTFASLLAINNASIFKIATWLGDDVRVVQTHYAKLLPQDEDIERAFSRKT